ncbi:MAG: hypothetical protein ACFFD2_04465 [Promethearchaeota archaeon]
MTELKKFKLLQSGDVMDHAVYCANCKNFDQELIGSKKGLCMGHEILDSSHPKECSNFQNDLRLISVLVFLNNGICVYHKAIVRDISEEIDPQLLSSFLSAIDMFGKDLTKEDISQIQFQKMNIVICRAEYSYGALLIKGEFDENHKKIFTKFLSMLEVEFQNYFKGQYSGRSLPEKEVDSVCLSFMKGVITKKLYTIQPETLKKRCFLKTAL